MRIRHTFLFSLIFSLPFLFLTASQAETLVEMEDFYPEEVYFSGFSIGTAQDVEIELNVIMPRKRSKKSLFSYAWILNSQTREVVWEVEDADQDDRDGFLAIFKDKVTLEPGVYEVYYSSFPQYYEYNGWFHGSSGFFSSLFDDDEYYFKDEFDELYIRIQGNGETLTSDEVLARHNKLKTNSFVSFTGLRDEKIEDQIFSVNKSTELEIYALGEAHKDGEYDFGWIVNLETRERVWELTYRRSDHAGGADKNRGYRDVITLEPGTYRLMYVTDDSHSYDRWNMAPPYDPEFWGITVWFKTNSEANNLARLDADHNYGITPIVEFNKVRDREYLSQGFTLKEDMDVQIYALGEGTDGDMYDYGWIVNLKSRRTIWKMDFYDTESAGGDEKNRIFDGLVNLEAGNYMVYYVTDGSHAYHSWNAGKPFDTKKWGITISVSDSKISQGIVSEYKEEDDASLLAKMTRMGDSDRRRAHFVVKEDQYVNIYALGEGSSGEMYDYAWIENANTGKVIWEMTYRKTARAGGGQKNRIFNDQILIPEGEYYVIYETDDSHSFEDWNASPPQDPGNWGITITLAQN